MIEQLTGLPDNACGFKMSGKLHDADYQTFVPAIDAAIAKHGKVRLLAQFHDFQGWDVHALWDDIKFSTTHCTTIERIALVGDRTWETYQYPCNERIKPCNKPSRKSWQIGRAHV